MSGDPRTQCFVRFARGRLNTNWTAAVRDLHRRISLKARDFAKLGSFLTKSSRRGLKQKPRRPSCGGATKPYSPLTTLQRPAFGRKQRPRAPDMSFDDFDALGWFVGDLKRAPQEKSNRPLVAIPKTHWGERPLVITCALQRYRTGATYPCGSESHENSAHARSHYIPSGATRSSARRHCATRNSRF